MNKIIKFVCVVSCVVLYAAVSYAQAVPSGLYTADELKKIKDKQEQAEKDKQKNGSYPGFKKKYKNEKTDNDDSSSKKKNIIGNVPSDNESGEKNETSGKSKNTIGTLPVNKGSVEDAVKEDKNIIGEKPENKKK